MLTGRCLVYTVVYTRTVDRYRPAGTSVHMFTEATVTQNIDLAICSHRHYFWEKLRDSIYFEKKKHSMEVKYPIWTPNRFGSHDQCHKAHNTGSWSNSLVNWRFIFYLNWKRKLETKIKRLELSTNDRLKHILKTIPDDLK